MRRAASPPRFKTTMRRVSGDAKRAPATRANPRRRRPTLRRMRLAHRAVRGARSKPSRASRLIVRRSPSLRRKVSCLSPKWRPDPVRFGSITGTSVLHTAFIPRITTDRLATVFGEKPEALEISCIGAIYCETDCPFHRSCSELRCRLRGMRPRPPAKSD